MSSASRGIGLFANSVKLLRRLDLSELLQVPTSTEEDLQNFSGL